ncbi:conserved hypothetical protein [Halomonas sp. 59]|nr:hypothetical protein HALOI3_20186 [Halomonas sp. I3]CAD5275148.1 conserved hypothetical protein [Halomonas sp. 113]CAD5276752.1 conserved hypothetical protein [Halomonas sp. 156]CAD5276899.1 conserved hypothetical protein [Halomonas sp. 59]VXB99111.1 conserved hypothetical protein [Halomonas titanicae]
MAGSGRELFAARQCLNSFCIEGLGVEQSALLEGFEAARSYSVKKTASGAIPKYT